VREGMMMRRRKPPPNLPCNGSLNDDEKM